ncbi:phenazine biosynthesis protein PhzF family [Actinacidiphila yanglinensis]|uniref:Phenazine biosynthesis protein PhzF family n=1 Tax=Actinacidiphila yanglinensis TaxID=310779 RepID=A0A1H5YNL5_9ACTN|nr:PhzF family phenazine biosynthesis isomerase [Actinacidiphila yanglinensis]SEG25350.1 phenazine biosynthesis protein PhzF family [Actinacidiphila yanglinensis]
MDVLRYVAFSTDPAGGNRAGVVLDATGADDAAMLAVAAEVGYSETAFAVPRADGGLDVRYFSPLAEVSFCGHATIAAAVAHAHAHGPGELELHTPAGLVRVASFAADDGTFSAELVSVPPTSEPLSPEDLAAVLSALGWAAADLDPALPPRVAYAGAWHPVIAVSTRQRLAALDYDMAALGDLMGRRGWTTVDLVWRESETVFHARNPFPPGGVVEDPATGAAAGAFGGYLRELGLVPLPATLTLHQGDDMGRPSLLTVGVSADPAEGIRVRGAAVPIPD